MTETRPSNRIQLEIGLVDIDRHCLTTHNGPRSLSPTEVALLSYLSSRPNEVLEKETLLRDVWGYSPKVQTRTLYTTVNRLRSKIERDPQRPQHLLTVPGRGYEFRPHASPPRDSPEDSSTVIQASPPTNLLAEVDSFFGRVELLTDIDSRFESGARLVTLLGPGGVGKTRASKRFGREKLHRYPGGVWFCRLSSARDVFSLLQAISAAVRHSWGSEDSLELTGDLGAHLARMGRTLLILDNLEQVVQRASPTVAQLMGAAPEAHFLVTSRERLRVGGEVTIDVSPLPEEDALALLRTRARARGASTEMGDGEQLREICSRLDGLPLALELAAARLVFLGPAQTLRALTHRFELLRGGRRDVDERHRTMRGAIEWSWQLLDPWEQATLAQLSVFRGGFNLDDSERVVLVEDGSEAPCCSEIVELLWERSLLVSQQTPWGPRFGLLQSIEDFAGEKLIEMGPVVLDSTRCRHMKHFSSGGIADPLSVAAESERIGRIGLNIENLEAAANRAAQLGDSEAEASSCLAAMMGLINRGPYGAILRQGRRIRALPGVSGSIRGQALYFESRALRLLGRHEEVAPILEQAMNVARRCEDRHTQGRVASCLGFDARCRGQWDEARDFYGQALELARVQQYPPGQASVLHELMGLERELGRVEAAHALLDELEALGHQFDLPQAVVAAMDGRAALARGAGDFEAALCLYQSAHQMEIGLGRNRRIHLVMGNMGEMHLEAGRLEEASELLELAVASFRDQGHTLAEGSFRGALALVQARQGEHEAAERCFIEALSLVEGGGGGGVIEHARLLCRWALARLAAGSTEDGRSLVMQAEALLDGAGSNEKELRRLCASVHQVLGEGR